MGPVWGFCFNLSGGTAMKNSTSHAGAPAQIHVTEMVGVSAQSWADAAQGIIEQAAKAHPQVTGMDVKSQTCVIRDGKIVEYHLTGKVAWVEKQAKAEK
jgi:flavin-binding protein dodecin